MANSTIITRKIEVYIHRHGDDDEAKQRLDYEYKLWRDINDNLYKAANRIMSHCFFNDAYEYRLKIQSPRLQEIDKALRYSKRDKVILFNPADAERLGLYPDGTPLPVPEPSSEEPTLPGSNVTEG